LAEASLTIISDCYEQDDLDKIVQSVQSLLPNGALRPKDVDNVSLPADPAIVASLIAGASLILSQLTSLIAKELLRRHRERQLRPANSAASEKGEAASVPAIVLVYDVGPPDVLAEVDDVPDSTRIANRGVVEIRLTLVDRFRVTKPSER